MEKSGNEGSTLIRYFKIGKGMIYVFDFTEKKIRKYGIRPPNKRIRLRLKWFLNSRFYLLSSKDFLISDPEIYLKEYNYRELILGISYI